MMKLRPWLFNLCIVLLAFSFQNCQPTSKSSPTSNPSIPAINKFGGNGEGYGGKLTLYAGASDIQIAFPSLLTMNNPSFTVQPSLPEGLSVDAKTGLISGNPPKASEDYQSYTMLVKNNDVVVQNIQFSLGVGLTYQVRADISGQGTSDVDLTDQVCADAVGRCSLKAALEQAGVHRVKTRIRLPGKTYLLGSRSIDIIGNVELIGSGKGLTILNGEDQSRVLNITGDDVTIKNLTVTHGKVFDPEYGAGILYEKPRGSLELAGIELSFNSDATKKSNGGGGLFFNGAKLLITNSDIHHNTSLVAGGYNGGGGGLYLASGTISLKDSVIADNTSSTSGGGIYTYLTTSLKMENMIFARNTTYLRGGAIYTGFQTSISINKSVFMENKSEFNEGGGIFWGPTAGNLLIENTTFAKNKATEGGAISIGLTYQLLDNSINISSSTFAENSTSIVGGGGAFRIHGDSLVHLVNSIIGFNGSQSCKLGDGGANKSLIDSAGANIDAGNSCNLGHIGTSDYLNNTDPLLAPLTAINGTFLFPLQIGSPAIDSGYKNCPVEDQSGVLRPQGAGCDSGAAESQ